MNIEQLSERYEMYDVDSINIKRNCEYFVIAKQKEYRIACPSCDSMDSMRRGLLPCKFRDVPFNNKHVWINYTKVRFHCLLCDKHYISKPYGKHENYMMTNDLYNFIKSFKDKRSSLSMSKETGVHYKTIQKIWSE